VDNLKACNKPTFTPCSPGRLSIGTPWAVKTCQPYLRSVSPLAIWSWAMGRGLWGAAHGSRPEKIDRQNIKNHYIDQLRDVTPPHNSNPPENLSPLHQGWSLAQAEHWLDVAHNALLHVNEWDPRVAELIQFFCSGKKIPSSMTFSTHANRRSLKRERRREVVRSTGLAQFNDRGGGYR
jgi:hypothetical protein